MYRCAEVLVLKKTSSPQEKKNKKKERNYLSYTRDHVLNVAADGTNASQLLPVAKPHLHPELFVCLAQQLHLNVDVLEFACKGAPSTFNGNGTRLYRDSY